MEMKYFLFSTLLVVVSLHFVASTEKDEDYSQVKKEVDDILKQLENEHIAQQKHIDAGEDKATAAAAAGKFFA